MRIFNSFVLLCCLRLLCCLSLLCCLRLLCCLSLLCCVSLLCCLTICAAEESPIRWRVAAIESKGELGKPLRLRLLAEIVPGWHLYSMKEIPGGPKPTRIELVNKEAWEWAAAIEAPEPGRARDTNFETEVEFYEGEVEFGLQLRRKAANKPPGLRVRYQCCTEKECLPPKTEVLTVSLP